MHYATPLYCATKPTNEIRNNDEADRDRYFWMLIDNNSSNSIEESERAFWVSAVTEEGILLFIKVKASFKEIEKGILITLLQQTTYYKSNDEIRPLYG